MSPEQMTSTRDVDGRTDIWALGVILYELVAGQPPFSADTMPQLCGLILSGPTPSIRSIRPNVPAGLDAVLRRCLEKEPGRRYPNVAEFAAALAEFAPKRARASVDRVGRVIQSGSMTTSGVVVASEPGKHAQTGDSWADTNKGLQTRSSRKGWWVALAATALLVVAVVVIARQRAAPVEATVVQPTLTPAAAAPPAQAALQETAPPPTPSVAPLASVQPAHDTLAPKLEGPRPTTKRPAPPAAPHTAAPPPPAPPPTAKPSDLFDDRK
jgi:serine/threonine-protein kinase